jgi:histidinol dehydrogenase
MMSAGNRILRRLHPDQISWPKRELPIAAVTPIVEAVRARGDAGVASVAAALGDPIPREVTPDEIASGYCATAAPLRTATESAASRIKRFARAQRAALSDVAYEVGGFRVGHRAVAIERVGIYVPAGRYPLPSSLLMGVIPARVAGVKQVAVCTARATPEILAAAYVAGVDRLFEIGGAQAIAALAFGTESVPKVDIIAGPGNAYVAAAKRLLFGVCGMDTLAGPSEIVVVASSDAKPAWIAADILAQAEHDEDARVLLMTDDEALVDDVELTLLEQLDSLETAAVARRALRNRGCCAILKLGDAIATVNTLAPEHIELHGNRAESFAAELTAFGALFVGSHSAEVFGDYGIGPNHILPTGSAARFSSGLSVFTFTMVRSFIEAVHAIDTAIILETAELARSERLDGHRKAALIRHQDSCG